MLLIWAKPGEVINIVSITVKEQVRINVERARLLCMAGS